MMRDNLAPGSEVPGSPEDISVASTEIIFIQDDPKTRRKLLKRQDEIRMRSHSADRLLDDDIQLKIELTPLVTQVTGWSTNESNDVRGKICPNKNRLSAYRAVSCDKGNVHRQGSTESYMSRQESFPSRSTSQQDSSLLDSRPSSQLNSRQSGQFDTRLDSISRQNSFQPPESPMTSSSLQAARYRRTNSIKNWALRRSYTGSVWDTSVEKPIRNSYSHMRHSTDIIDTLESAKPARSRLDLIEENLYLGNMDAATDILTLQTHSISRIVTVDSVPLPRKISSLLPRITSIHIQVTDIPSEDLLNHFTRAVEFIERGIEEGSAVLVHCFYGKSRSASIVLAYLMQKHRISLDKALEMLRKKRSTVCPNPGFKAQLRLWEAMKYKIDNTFLRYKMYKTHMVSERMRKAKLLPLDALKSVLETQDPRSCPSIVYKCKQCRKPISSSLHQLPHITGENPYWYTPIPKQHRGKFCSKSVYISPMDWMVDTIRNSLSGKLLCPYCRSRIGQYSWVLGLDCTCGASVSPAFRLDITAIIFKTEDRHLQRSSSRQPVLV